jgi:general secretion pathway protein D
VGAFVFGESQNVGQNSGGSSFGGAQGGGGSSGGQSQNQISGAVISRVSAAPGGVSGGRSGGQQQQSGSGGGLNYITKTNNMEEVSGAARNYFQSLGVDLDPQRNPGKALFFNDRQGVLIVRATMQDLDMIEAAIQTLNIVPAQVNVKAKFIEVQQVDSKALGFDWYLGSVSMNNGSIFGQGGSAASLSGANSPYTVFPGNAFAGTTIASSTTDQTLTGGLRNSSTSLFTLTGILTDPQFRMVLHALEQRQGVEILAQPEVTTQSGRQAQMKATNIKTIITGFSYGANNQATTSGGANNGNVIVNQATIVFPLPEQLEQGPVLDVIPCVLSDGFTVNLTLIPTIAQFTGYDNPNEVLTSGITLPTGSTLVPTVLPTYTVRQVASSVNVWDGQTVVLGGLISETVTTVKDKVPMLGDLPLLGRFFRSESKNATKANLLIFVTPTLIDPAGNRLHSEDEMPFAQAAYPVRPAAAVGQEKN